jgi:Protein of unknown function (DUF1571)
MSLRWCRARRLSSHPDFDEESFMLRWTRWPGARGYLALVLVGCGLVGGVWTTSSSSATPDPEPARPATPAAQPIDESLRLLTRAQQAFAGVHDYTCTLIKQERVRGTLTPLHVITMMVRNQPFSVYLKWHQPKECVGQEACYVAGKNGGNMRARSPGILGSVGFVSVDPNDPRAKKTSSHAITETGLGNMMRRFAERWEAERKLNRIVVKTGEYEYNKRRCIRCETAYTQTVPGMPFYRSVIYFDKELALPIRVELYDWPREGGKPGGELLETYSYVNLRLNPNLPDSVFDK